VSECRWRGGGAALTSLSNLRVAVVEEFDELWQDVIYAIQNIESLLHTSSSSVGIVKVVLLVSHAQ
jgi:hypothetical protein